MLNIDSDIKNFIDLGGFIGLAQINPIAGNLEYNSQKIIEYIKNLEFQKKIILALIVVLVIANLVLGIFLFSQLK